MHRRGVLCGSIGALNLRVKTNPAGVEPLRVGSGCITINNFQASWTSSGSYEWFGIAYQTINPYTVPCRLGVSHETHPLTIPCLVKLL